MGETVSMDNTLEMRGNQNQFGEGSKMKSAMKIVAEVKGILREVKHNWAVAEFTHPRRFSA